jgi:hypothetical protein
VYLTRIKLLGIMGVEEDTTQAGKWEKDLCFERKLCGHRKEEGCVSTVSDLYGIHTSPSKKD